MDASINRVLLVYKMLGQVLNDPQSFGLGDHAPKRLVEALGAMRQSLCEDMTEECQLSTADWLSDELSQDADQPKALASYRRG